MDIIVGVYGPPEPPQSDAFCGNCGGLGVVYCYFPVGNYRYYADCWRCKTGGNIKRKWLYIPTGYERVVTWGVKVAKPLQPKLI